MTKNYKIYIKTLFILIFGICYLNNNAQNAKDQSENIRLITDRLVYLAGDEIHFSAFYKSFGNSNIQLSNILYFELYDNRGSYYKSKFRINEHKVYGSVQIPDDILSGNYYIRAYTKYQRNFPAERMCINLISVINPNKAYPKENLTNLKQFESSALESSNNMTKIILRLNEKLLYETKKIIVTDNQNKIVEEAIPFKNGLVLFELSNLNKNGLIKQITNSSDTNYISKVSEIEHPFLSIESEYEFSKLIELNLFLDKRIANQADNLELLIKSPDYENIVLQEIKIDSTRKMNLNQNIFDKTGFYYFIILDKNLNIIYVTSHFINFNKKIKFNMSLNKKIYSNREKASITLNHTQDINFDYGIIKITKRGLNIDEKESLPRFTTFDYNILNSFLANKSIVSKEYSDQINATISLNNHQLNSDSFKKQIFFKSKYPPAYIPDIKDISIEGTIIDKKSGKPIMGIDVFASVVSGNDQIHHYRSDNKGQFIFSVDGSKSEQNLFITVKPIENEIKISIHNDFHDKYYTTDNIPLIADTTNIDLYTALFINKQAKKIFKKGIKNDFIFEQIKALDIEGAEDYSILMKDYIQSSNVTELLNEIVPFVKVEKSDKKFVISIYNEVLQYKYLDPLVLIDYMPIFNIDEILKINPLKIEKIDLINQQYVIGNYQFNGIILIHTNTKDFADVKHPVNSVFLKYMGAKRQTIPTFPVYELTEQINDHKADFRDLLYYQSFSGKLPKKIDFFTSDSDGEYDIYFYGTTKEGNNINLYESLKVE